MKKRIFAILIPTVAAIALTGTGLGLYIANMYDDGRVKDLDLNVNVESLVTNKDMKVTLNESYGGLKLIDSTNIKRVEKTQTIEKCGITSTGHWTDVPVYDTSTLSTDTPSFLTSDTIVSFLTSTTDGSGGSTITDTSTNSWFYTIDNNGSYMTTVDSNGSIVMVSTNLVDEWGDPVITYVSNTSGLSTSQYIYEYLEGGCHDGDSSVTTYYYDLGNNPLNHTFALDFEWDISSFLNSGTNVEQVKDSSGDITTQGYAFDLQWRKVKDLATPTAESQKFPKYLPTIGKSPEYNIEDNGGNGGVKSYTYDDVFLPYDVEVTISVTVPSLLLPALTCWVQDGTSKKYVGPSKDINWDSNTPNKFTTTLSMNSTLNVAKEQLTGVRDSVNNPNDYRFFKTDLDGTNTLLTPNPNFETPTSAYNNFAGSIKDKYDNLTLIDKNDASHPDDSIVKGFLGNFNVELTGADGSLGHETDWFKIIEALNNLQKSTASNDDKYNVKVEVDSVQLDYLLSTFDESVYSTFVDDPNNGNAKELGLDINDLYGSVFDGADFSKISVQDTTNKNCTTKHGVLTKRYKKEIYNKTTPVDILTSQQVEID